VEFELIYWLNNVIFLFYKGKLRRFYSFMRFFFYNKNGTLLNFALTKVDK